MKKKTLYIIAGSSLLLIGGLITLLISLCTEPPIPVPAPPPPPPEETDDSLPAMARKQIGVTVHYEATYEVLDYPGGDLPIETGVCTDVIIRALRHKGIDLQQLVHEDMKQNYRQYPCRKLWKQRAPDPSIDHRRVPNLEVFFTRIGWRVTDTPTTNPADYLPGDIVTYEDKAHDWQHILIVSNHINEETGIPKVIHNSGNGTEENDDLFKFPIQGHFRPVYNAPITIQKPKPKEPGPTKRAKK